MIHHGIDLLFIFIIPCTCEYLSNGGSIILDRDNISPDQLFSDTGAGLYVSQSTLFNNCHSVFRLCKMVRFVSLVQNTIGLHTYTIQTYIYVRTGGMSGEYS